MSPLPLNSTSLKISGQSRTPPECSMNIFKSNSWQSPCSPVKHPEDNLLSSILSVFGSSTLPSQSPTSSEYITVKLLWLQLQTPPYSSDTLQSPRNHRIGLRTTKTLLPSNNSLVVSLVFVTEFLTVTTQEWKNLFWILAQGHCWEHVAPSILCKTWFIRLCFTMRKSILKAALDSIFILEEDQSECLEDADHTWVFGEWRPHLSVWRTETTTEWVWKLYVCLVPSLKHRLISDLFPIVEIYI